MWSTVLLFGLKLYSPGTTGRYSACLMVPHVVLDFHLGKLNLHVPEYILTILLRTFLGFGSGVALNYAVGSHFCM
jgi:hypothetical protein